MKATFETKESERRRKQIKGFSWAARAILLALLLIEGAGLLAAPITILSLVTTWKGLNSHDFANFFSLISLLSLPFAFLVTLNFFRLFTRLRDGHLFDSQNILYLKRAGKWWMAAGITQTVPGIIALWIFHPANNIGIPASCDGIMAGLIVFFIAWLFGEAQALQEEQELTV